MPDEEVSADGVAGGNAKFLPGVGGVQDERRNGAETSGAVVQDGDGLRSAGVQYAENVGEVN